MSESNEQVKLFSNGLKNEILDIILNELFFNFDEIIEDNFQHKKAKNDKNVKFEKIKKFGKIVNLRQKAIKEFIPQVKLDAIDSDNIREDIEKINKLNEEFEIIQKLSCNLNKYNKIVDSNNKSPALACDNYQNNKIGIRKINSYDNDLEDEENVKKDQIKIYKLSSRKSSSNTINENVGYKSNIQQGINKSLD